MALPHDRFPSGTEFVHGMPWSPRMVMEFRGLSQRSYDRLRKSFSLTDILLKHGVIANHGKRRRFIDRTDPIMYEGRPWTLPMIYMLTTENEYEHDRVIYRLFAQRIRNEMRTVPDIKQATDNVIERMGYAPLSMSMRNMTDAKYERIAKNYVEYVSNQRERIVFFTQAEIKNDWIRCARADSKMHWYVVAVQDEYYMDLMNKYNALQEMYVTQHAELTRLRAEQLETTKQIMEYKAYVRSIESDANNGRKKRTSKVK